VVRAGEFSVDANGKTWTVVTVPNTTCRATGTALPEFLRPKLVVQFAADVDESGASKDKVGELTIVSPSPDRAFGVFEGQGGSANSVPPPPPKGAGKQKGKAAPAAAGGFDNSKKAKVVGKVVSFKENHMVVGAGKRHVEIDLTEEPLIHVDLSDGSLASTGDQVVVKGKEIQGKQVCEAQSVQITFAQPLSNPKKRLALAKAERESHHSHKSTNDKELKDDDSSDDAAGDDAKKDAAKDDAAKKDAPAKDEKPANADPKAK
jgi:hypothetical protein